MSGQNHQIALIDDDPDVLASFEVILMAAGFTNIRQFNECRRALAEIAADGADVALLDLNMPGMPGEHLLPLLLETDPTLPVVVVSGANDLGTAVDCIKKGAYDYLGKPVDADRLVTTVKRALEWGGVERENRRLRDSIVAGRPRAAAAFGEFVTRDPRTLAILAYAEAVAASPRPVLITGESGVGKELVANALARLSSQPSKRLVAVNTAGLDEQMFSDTLFGHLPGAFTGASGKRVGLVEKAAGATLFLDEIGDLGQGAQVKLLRLLQEDEFFPLGADEPRRSSARIVLATNRDLEAMMAAGNFRSDLYHRLKTHHVHLPPLRERCGDIIPLAEYFIARAAGTLGVKAPGLAGAATTILSAYQFPGNARELESLIFDAVLGHHREGLIPGEHFQHLEVCAGSHKLNKPAIAPPHESASDDNPFANMSILPTPNRARELLAAEALRRSHGNQAAAARMIGVSPQALNSHLKRHALPPS